MLPAELAKILKGKTIDMAELSNGTVKLRFTDGTRFAREKTCEGIITAFLFDAEGNVVASARI
ncbi:MAG: hypothetical protein GX977_05860 [Firmicutes bacterium]|nr:hypothetical protein [Bacillota bacterium]